ncbi:CdaR family transcriptional regulator [Bacillus sp. 1P02SD]|uniref:CdaR family transcriptional regulator n=1 Tax=Bacillus sp. 1P02SD TaxID=3132264 RepID=UPI0039A08491
MLTREIADKIVQQTIKRLGRNINIIDTNGIILSSGERARIGTFHKGGHKVIETGEKLYLAKQDIENYQGALPGINLPIKFQNEVIGVVGISGAPEEVGEFGELVVMMTELMIQQIVILDEVEWKYRTREFLLEEILSESPQFPKINQKLKLLGIELEDTLEVIVIKIYGNFKNLISKNVYEGLSDFIPTMNSVSGFIDSKTFAIVLNSQIHRKETILERCFSFFNNYFKIVQVGTGHPVNKLSQVYDAYKEIETAIKVSDKNIVWVQQLETEIVLSSIAPEKRKKFLDSIINSLSEEWLYTITLFFENDLNISETAKQLFIHRNTLTYRLDKVLEITGYDPRKFSDAVILRIALYFQRFNQIAQK